MKKFLILISFIFVFLSCCFTSFEVKTPNITPANTVQQISMACTTVEKSDISTEYYIVSSAHLNLSQYFSNIFGNMCAVSENNTYKKLNLYLVFTHWENFTSSNLKISTVLNPRAP